MVAEYSFGKKKNTDLADYYRSEVEVIESYKAEVKNKFEVLYKAE